MLACLLFVGMGAWGADTVGSIRFGTSFVRINAASVNGDDDLGNNWSITTVGTTSFTTNAAYYQVGSSSNPATSITFTTTLPSSVKIKAMSAKFGGFASTTGTVSLKVGSTTVGSGSLNGTNDVTVASTSSATGTVLTVTVTGIAKGVKVYNISYTIDGNDSSDPVDASWSVNPSEVILRATKSQTATITTDYDGTLSVSSNNTGVATATINGKVITVTGVTEGTTTLSVTGAATSSYNAISKSISVTVTPDVPTPGTYNIIPNNAFWGTSHSGSISSVSANSLTLNGESDDISIQLKNGSSTNGYVNGEQTRVYSNYTMRFSVPTGFDITAIAFTADGNNWAGTHTASAGTMTDSKNWAGASNEVTITFGGTCRITKISVTYAVHVAPSATYTVTFDAGANGNCSTSQLTEASAGAGVTLPGVTANTGWDFVGWSTSDTPTSANAGVAGDTYYPTADCTLYAYYTKHIPSFSGSYVDFDLSTDNTATATDSEMTWTNSVVNIAAAKAGSSTDVNNYYPGASTPRTSTRFYAKSTLTFTPSAGVTITGIEYTATSNDYATAFENNNWTNGVAVADAANKIVYVTPTNGTQAVSATIGTTTGGTKFRVYYTCPNFNITTADTDFYSLYIDRAVTIPSNVTAYTGSLEGNTLTLTQIEGGTIPANTGVVFKTTEAGTATFVAAAGVDPIANNDIKGVVVDTPVANVEAGAGNVVLVLGVVDGNVCFAKPNTSTLGANKAYIIAPSSAAKGIRMVVNGETTGINTIEIVKANNISYNLNGQRVNANAKGIVIVNGRKYINK